MNNTIRTLQSIIDRNTNAIRHFGMILYSLNNRLEYLKYQHIMEEFSTQEYFERHDLVRKDIKTIKNDIKRKANEQRVLKKLIADEIEIAYFNRKFE